MARQIRNFFPEGMYHILQRGHNRSFIFGDISDKYAYIRFFKEALLKYPMDILYYVLMDNHVHLIVRMKELEPSHAMKYLNNKYSRFYNKKYHRTGTIFGQRFTSYLISDTKYFLQLIHYIAFNPVKAKMVKSLNEYKWGAHYEIINGDRKLLDKRELFKVIDISFKRGEKVYFDLINEKIKPENLPRNACESIKDEREKQLYEILDETCKCKEQRKKLLNKSKLPEIIQMRKSVILTAKKSGSLMISDWVVLFQHFLRSS